MSTNVALCCTQVSKDDFLLYVWAKISVACFIVFLGLFLNGCSQDFQGVFPKKTTTKNISHLNHGTSCKNRVQSSCMRLSCYCEQKPQGNILREGAFTPSTSEVSVHLGWAEQLTVWQPRAENICKKEFSPFYSVHAPFGGVGLPIFRWGLPPSFNIQKYPYRRIQRWILLIV